MSEEVFDCAYNLWTGFVGKATCEAGFLKCDEMSCPAYTRRPKKKPQTNADRIRSMTDEELARWVNFHTDCENCPNRECADPYRTSNSCVNSLLSWLKSPVEVGNGT